MPRRSCFHPCPFVGQSVCQQDYTKITEWIFYKNWMEDSLDPEQTPLTFAVDSDKEMDPGTNTLY